MERKRNTSRRLLLTGLLATALLVYVVWLTTGSAQARLIPATVTAEIETRAINVPVMAPSATNWCAAGSFQAWNNASTPMYDDGTQGDLVANDGIYSLDTAVSVAGRL